MRKAGGGHGGGGGGGHDGGGSMRWLLTYADMITLLMAFFIMLYSMSVLNLAKFHQVAVSIRSGFGGVMTGQGKDVLNASGQISVKPSIMPGSTAGVPYAVIQKIKVFVKENKLEKAVRMYVDRRGFVVSLLSDHVLFPIGSAEIRPQAGPILYKIGEMLRTIPNDVRIEGHTCDLPIHTKEFPSNWELSTSRATNVVRFLIDNCHIAPARLSAAGYSDTHPYVPNTSNANRILNRRVEIVVLRAEPLYDSQPELHAAPAPPPAGSKP